MDGTTTRTARIPRRALLALALVVLAIAAGALATSAQAGGPIVSIVGRTGAGIGHVEPADEPDTWKAWATLWGHGTMPITITCDRRTQTCGTEDGRQARCPELRGCTLTTPEEDVRTDAPYAIYTPSADVTWNMISLDARHVGRARPPRKAFPAPGRGFPGGAVVLLQATYAACDSNVVDHSGVPCPDPRLRRPVEIPSGQPFAGPRRGPRVERRELFAWRPAGGFSPRAIARGENAVPVRCSSTTRCALAHGRAPRAGRPARVTRAGDAWIVRDADGWRLGRVLGLDAGRRSGEIALRAAVAKL